MVGISKEESSDYIIPSCPFVSAKANAKEKGSGKCQECNNFGLWSAGLPSAFLLLIHNHFSANHNALTELLMHYSDL